MMLNAPQSTPTPTLRESLDPSLLDAPALATTRLVMSTHSGGWQDVEDAVAVYHWMLRGSSLPAGLVVYPSPREAAVFLHGYRLAADRDIICQDPACPGGNVGPAGVRDVVKRAAMAPLDEFALSTTRFVIGYHPSHDTIAETLAVYAWVVEARALEEAIMPTPTTGAERNANRLDHAASAAVLLHDLRAAEGRDHGCAYCTAALAAEADAVASTSTAAATASRPAETVESVEDLLADLDLEGEFRDLQPLDFIRDLGDLGFDEV